MSSERGTCELVRGVERTVFQFGLDPGNWCHGSADHCSMEVRILREKQGQTWLMTEIAAVLWRFEAGEWLCPYLLLKASAACAYSSIETGVRFLTRGIWKGSAPAKLRHDNATRDR